MSLSPRQAFKFGFLLRCADENLSPLETESRIKYAMACLQWDGQTPLPLQQDVVDSALAAWEKQAVGGAIGGITNLMTTLGITGLLGGAGLGAAGGHLAARMTEGDADPEEMKQQELMAAYRQQAERIRRQMAARSYRQPKAPRPPSLVT